MNPDLITPFNVPRVDVKDLLIRTRARIERVECFTTGKYARHTPDGDEVDVGSEEATCWCTFGALQAECDIKPQDSLYKAAKYMLGISANPIWDRAFPKGSLRKLPFSKVLGVNDDLGHAHVMQMFGFTIAACDSPDDFGATLDCE